MKHIKPKLEPHSKILAQALKDPKVKKEYDALDDEFKEIEKNYRQSVDSYTDLKGLPTDEVYDLGLRMCKVLTFIYGVVVGIMTTMTILLLTGTI